jgi:serine protease Do
MKLRVIGWCCSAAVLGLTLTAMPGLATERSHSKVLAAFRDVVSVPSQSTVRIFADGHKAALGAIVGSDGYIVTKASELKGRLEVQVHDGRKVEGRIIGRDPALDIALVKIDGKDLPTVRWGDAKAASVGSWVVTTGLEREPVAIGVVSVPPRKIAAPSGALGVQLENDDAKARIAGVMPGSAAEKAGMQAGDQVVRVNDKPIGGRQELVDTIRGYMPGDEVTLLVRRGEEELTLNVKLGSLSMLVHGERAEFQNNLGGPLSERRAGFPSALQHDTVLRPSDCGGPLVNLDGETIGINIARAGRVESYALTADVVQEAVQKLMSNQPGHENLAESPTQDGNKKVQ